MVTSLSAGHDGTDVPAAPDMIVDSSHALGPVRGVLPGPEDPTGRRIPALANAASPSGLFLMVAGSGQTAGRQRLRGLACGIAPGRALPVRRRGFVLAPAALAVLAVIGLSACNKAAAGGAQTYRAHGVSFDYPAGWREGNPGAVVGCCNSDRLWAAAVGPDSADSIDVGAGRSSPSITAQNAGLAVPALDQYARSFFEQAGGSLQAGPERITMGGMPGIRFQGSARPHGIANEVTLVIAFNGTTDYWVTCAHTAAKAAEVQRACGQVVRTFKTSKAILAGGAQIYRAHGISFDYPAGWLEGSMGVTSGQAPLWAAAFGLGPAAWMDIRAPRTVLTSPVTAGNIGVITPSVVRAVRRLFTIQAGPERITIGGMPGLRFQGETTVHRVPTKITLVVAFNGTTQYELACGHTQATAREVTRACAQVIRTFKVSKAG
jgi:hypothetical protein